MQKKSRLNCEMIWNIWEKGKLNSEKIWKIQRKGKSNSEKIWEKQKNVSRIEETYGKYGGKAS